MAPRSPYTAAYDRLENGLGGPAGTKRTPPWRKIIIGAVVIIALVYLLAPSDSRKALTTGWAGIPEADSDSDLEDIHRPKFAPPPPPPTVPKPNTSKTHKGPIPTSPQNDPDMLKTVHCDNPYPGITNHVQYAIMIDAGSTGSRIHIYKFHNCEKSPTYEYEVFKMTKPGLSSYKNDPVAAAKSLDVLMDEAVRTVPESLRSCAPVAVKATAGLRLLGAEQSDAILAAVRERLLSVYPFPLPEKDAVVIMDGKDEGVFAWITANYLLDTIRANSPTSSSTYAVLDLGGASTQIVFEPIFGKPNSSLNPGEHKYDLTFGGKTYVLYQHSYLGYGLMRARSSAHRLVEFMSTLNVSGKKDSVTANPCLAVGTSKTVEIEDEQTGVKRKVEMTGGDLSSFEACNRIIELVMAKDAICEVKPCSFNGVYQPSLMETFASGKVMLLSYFYDRLSPLLVAEHITVASIASLAQDVCLGQNAWNKRWGTNQKAMDELVKRPEYCLDLTFMHGLLSLGYEFEDKRRVTISKSIQGTELGWCLGATIAMVGGSLTCRL